jgi:hypothetical protein
VLAGNVIRPAQAMFASFAGGSTWHHAGSMPVTPR